MAKYPKYATTVIGAHSVSDWYEAFSFDELGAWIRASLDGLPE